MPRALDRKYLHVRFVASVVLAAGIVACLGPWIIGPTIAYFDCDDSTQGIFINDLSYRGSLDASFQGRQDPQDIYRTAFAAQRLAFSLPLSWAQRALRLPPWDTEALLRAAAVLFSLGGSWLAVCALLPSSRGSTAERWTLVAAAAAHPSLAIFGRTGASYYTFAYALFWLGMLASSRWLENRRPAWIYVAGCTAGLCLLNPYPPLFCWPIAACVLVVAAGGLRATLRNPHPYVAGAVGLFAAALATFWMAATYETSLSAFLARLAAFRAYRGGAVALSKLWVSPLDKLVKLADQQLLFRVDRLGDATRGDSVWTLGALQPAVLIWALAALIGIWGALRQRSNADRVTLTVTAVVLAFFFTVSFPEGRFVLALIPCWAFFALRGIRLAIPGDVARKAVVGLLLLLLAWGTERGIRRRYEPSTREIMAASEGMRAAAPLIAALPGGAREVPVGMPYPKRFESELYFRMVMPDRVEWTLRPDFARMLAGPPRPSGAMALAYADDAGWLRYLASRGFTRGGSVRGEITGRPIDLLWLPQVEHNPSP